jgi:hypothetical protein
MIIKTKGEYEFLLANGHLAGKIVYDKIWECWRFESNSCRLSKEYIKELNKFMDKLK